MKHSHFLISALLLTSSLMGSCSSSPSSSDGAASHVVVTTTSSTERATGIKVDSLNGIPGHHFGEPLGAFAGLKEGESGVVGMKRYYYPSGQAFRGHGWFGKHADQLTTNYYFIDGKFAYFTSLAYGNNTNLLNSEANYLFGKGDRYKLDGFFWQGKLARAIYTQPLTPQGPCVQLEVVSEPLEASLKQNEVARLEAENN